MVYNRHLLSDLHARRSIGEIDGVLCLPRTASLHVARKSSPRNQVTIIIFLSARFSRIPYTFLFYALFVISLSLSLSDRQRTREASETKGVKKSWRKREKEIVCCEMCHARVRRAQMGKHLLSHYHCRVAGVIPRGPRARRFLLENMANVVRQCPFQCFSCRFYCNTEETFLRHWRSDLHAKTLEQVFLVYRAFRFTAAIFLWPWCTRAGAAYLLDSRDSRSPVAATDVPLATIGAKTRKLWILTCSDRAIATWLP